MKTVDLSEDVAVAAAAIEEEASAVSALVARHRAHDKALDAYLAPLRVFTRNQGTDAYKASEVAAIAAAGSLVDAANLAIAEVVAALDPGTREYDVTRGDALVAEVKEAVDSKFVEVSADVLTAAGLATTHWTTAKNELRSLNPGQYRTNRGNVGRRGPRGPGQLVETQGFRLVMECGECGAVKTSGSNPGSAQDQMANHAAEHQGGERTYATGPYADNHRGFTEAMNAVLDADTTASGGGWTIHREYVTSAA